MSEIMLRLPGLSPVNGKALSARFDGGALSSDAGLRRRTPVFWPGVLTSSTRDDGFLLLADRWSDQWTTRRVEPWSC